MVDLTLETVGRAGGLAASRLRGLPFPLSADICHRAVLPISRFAVLARCRSAAQTHEPNGGYLPCPSYRQPPPALLTNPDKSRNNVIDNVENNVTNNVDSNVIYDVKNDVIIDLNRNRLSR